MSCGHGLRLTMLLLVMVSAMTSLFAQEPEARRLTRYEQELWDEYRGNILFDTTIFYRAVQSAEDIFADVADHGMSFVAFRRRGEEPYGGRTLFEGIPLRSEHRTVLNNLKIDRRRYSGFGNSERYAAGVVAGFTEYRSELAEPLLSGLVSADFSDKGYIAGVRAYAAETFAHDWSLSVYAGGRTGRDLHVDGVFTNAADAGLHLLKHWNYRHRLTLTAIFSPSERGMRRASVAEAFTLTGNNLYNPSWGYFNGKVRNANVRRVMMPAIVAAFTSEISPATTLTLSAGGEAGTRRYSSLDWFDAMTPLPDNYHYLPSWYSNPGIAGAVAEAWRGNDTRHTQIDWDELYRRNTMRSDGHSIYAVSDRVERVAALHLRAAAVTEAGGGLTLGYGLHLSAENNRCWQQMRDLMGGSHIVDIDHYLIDDATYGNKLQNDLRHPNRIVGEGDRFGYDYSFSEVYAGAFATLRFQRNRSRFDAAAEVGNRSIVRRGYFEKELFAGDGSFGPSRRTTMAPYAVKMAYGYSFTPRHYLELRLSMSGRMPEAEDLFLQSRYNNRTVDNPRLRTDYGGEVNYTFLHNTVDLRLSAFAFMVQNDCEVSHYYDDLESEYSDMVVSGIGRLHLGMEAAANIRITRYWSASAALTAGRYRYSADPRVTLYADSDNRLLVDRAVAHMGGCRVGNTPQIAATGEVAWSRNGWGVRMSLNYAGLRYVEPAAMRRTDRVSRQGSVSEEIFRRYVTQERLPDAVEANAGAWRVFRIRSDAKLQSRIVLSLSVNNLAGSRNTIYNGRESVRISRTRVADGYIYAPFATTYLYSYPRTFRLSVSWRF